MIKTVTKLWVGIVILVILSPLGLMAAKILNGGSAWGEWGTDELKRLAGYIPAGFERVSGLWKTPIAGYAFDGWKEKGLFHLGLAYVMSAAAGIGIIAALTLFIGKFPAGKDD